MNNGLKKLLLAAGVLATSYIMVGCSVKVSTGDETTVEDDSKFEMIHMEWNSDVDSEIVFLKDKETGCEYILSATYRTQTMTPRLGDDGLPVCGDE